MKGLVCKVQAKPRTLARACDALQVPDFQAQLALSQNDTARAEFCYDKKL
jgi:hypothetical protein